MKKISLLTFIFFSFITLLNGESFRVAKTNEAFISSPTDNIKLQAGINDAVAITIPNDLTYISGIEVTVKIPEIITNYRNSVSYSLYDNISPSPSAKTLDYTGTQLTFDGIPGKLSETIIIPLFKDSTFKETPYAKVLKAVPTHIDGKLFLRFMLSTKGIPEAMYEEKFDITIKPVLVNKGRVKINVIVPEELKENAYAIYIDDKLTNETPQQLYTTGEHHLSIVSDAFRNEVRTFRIDQAETVNVTVHLKDISPTVKFTSPDNATIYFDNQLINNKKEELLIKLGDHQIKFIIGDYEIVQTLFAENGRTYTINLNVDVQITESE